MDFSGQVCIVTGAGSGIGCEIAKRLAIGGAAVIVNDVDPSLAEKVANDIMDDDGVCVAMPGDASDADFINKMVQTAVYRFGKLDITIANAGITLFESFLDYKAESLEKVMRLNLGGSFLLAQASARQMKAQGKGGSILFMSSVTGHQAHKDLAAYGMTKAGLEMLAKMLVAELSAYKITVNCVAPGATATERTLEDKNYEKTWSIITPMGRPAYVEDIANAALFLVSGASRHITGQSLVVDGGWTSMSPTLEP